MKSFIQFLKESNIHTVYFDMDGLLADFEGETKRLFGKFNMGLAEKQLEMIKNGESSFEDLKVLPEGRKVFKFVSKFVTPSVLSSASHLPIAVEQKHNWLKKHFPTIPRGNINIVMSSHDKKNFAKEGAILIDDFKRNVEQFESAGGIGIYHTGSSAPTIKKLKEFL